MQDIPNSNAPLVTFIIPAYNVPQEMLTECLQSILGLSLKETEREIIVVDDGSQTPLPPMPRGCRLVPRSHAGLGATRNAGIDLAEGDFIQFVDADDTLPDTYNTVIQRMREGDDDIILFQFTRTLDLPQQLDGWSPQISGAELLSLHNIRASACCYAFRRSILRGLRFPEGLLHEDEAFTPLLFLRAQRVSSTPTACYCYRERPASITTGGNHTQRLDDMHEILRRLNLSGQGTKMTSPQLKALRRRIAQLTMDYIYNVMTLTQSIDEVERRVSELQKDELFPLPAINCTHKYAFFRKLAATAAGRRILMKVVLNTKREK